MVGVGKIARDQHVPAIANGDTFELVAAASPHHQLKDTPNYPSLEAMLKDCPGIEAVAVCTPPQVRYDLARHALEHGCHVLLEKPPGATLNEVHGLISLAQQQGLALFATWHSREAAGVEPAREWLAARQIRAVRVEWKEDVRVWHPGQSWIWKAGGLGVFDPGINALSILTRILPGTLVLKEAELAIPANCETPIAAKLALTNEQHTTVQMELDFLHAGTPTWTIWVDTDAGELRLENGGAVLRVDGHPAIQSSDVEYGKLYARFAQLIGQRRIDVDLAPFNLVADAFLQGRRIQVEPFLE